jgi:putative ABC transport system permease protein
VGRFIWSQLLHRRSRTATLALGILVAAVSFTLLTSAVTTSALEARGTVAGNWRTAYDILVRPKGSFTSLERTDGLVSENYLSGIFGGITMRQWNAILAIPGVEAAAPIANIGYILPFQEAPISIDRYLTDDPYQLYRIRQVRLADNGLSSYPDGDLYVYYTRAHRFVDRAGDPHEEVPGQPRKFPVCNGYNFSGPISPRSPFDRASRSYMRCFSSRSPDVARKEYGAPFGAVVGQASDVNFPILLAAIDPVQENRLLDLDGTVVSGRPLGASESWLTVPDPSGGDYKERVAPVLASTTTYVDETLQATVERLTIPGGVDLQKTLASSSARSFLPGLQGRAVGTQRYPLGSVYDRFLGQAIGGLHLSFESYRTVSPVEYRELRRDRLEPVPTTNPKSVWKSELYGTYLNAPTENSDVQFRKLTSRAGDTSLVGGVINLPGVKAVGEFDPTKLPGFSPLSKVPLETYYPPVAEPADAASREALGGGPLLPTLNVGGYIAQPPLMLTTLQAARLFLNPQYFTGADPKAPIGVIRVKVSGVTGPDPVSRERVRRVGQAIHDRTGLAVDITAGSSPTPILVQLPAGTFGQPPLLVSEGWVKKGVAVVILRALDRKSLALFVLVLVVTGLFLMNGALASVRARRSEIGTLLALGWSREKVFRAVLGELALIGLAAGLAGTGIAAAFVKLFGFRMPLSRTLLVAPVAMALATVAGLVPAWRAARSLPLDAVRPAVAKRRSVRHVRRIGGMALANLRRLPGRTLLAAAGLFVGVGALALLLSITLAFRGSILGTALGAFISVQVRTVDYLGVVLAVVLAALSVADVLFLNLRERAPELVTLRASGWRDRDLGRMVALEGLGIGLLGSVAGAGAGIGLSALVGGPPGRIVLAGVIAAVAGTAIALAAALVPASLVSRMTPPAVLAEE